MRSLLLVFLPALVWGQDAGFAPPNTTGSGREDAGPDAEPNLGEVTSLVD